MLSCPLCGSVDYERYRSPELVEDVVVRRKRCKSCRHVFSTGEVVISQSLAERILDKITANALPAEG